jgi:hypothetical protein
MIEGLPTGLSWSHRGSVSPRERLNAMFGTPAGLAERSFDTGCISFDESVTKIESSDTSSAIMIDQSPTFTGTAVKSPLFNPL